MPWRMCVYVVYTLCNTNIRVCVCVNVVAPRGAAGRVLTPRCTGNVRTVTNPASTAKKVFIRFHVLNAASNNAATNSQPF